MESKSEVDAALYLEENKHKYQLKTRFSSFFMEKKRVLAEFPLEKMGLKAIILECLTSPGTEGFAYILKWQRWRV